MLFFEWPVVFGRKLLTLSGSLGVDFSFLSSLFVFRRKLLGRVVLLA